MGDLERQLCESPGCEGTEVGKTKKCVKCIAKLEAQGWVFSKHGSMKNSKTGVNISPRGSVTVTANYNPRMMALMTNEIAIEDLDDEELARGMCRNENGQFPKRQPSTIPKAMYDRMIRELFERSDEKLREGLIDAVEAMTKMMTNEEVDASTRLKAATWVFERLRGKTPDVVKVTQEKPFEQVLNHVHRGPRPERLPQEDGDAVEEPPVAKSTPRAEQSLEHAAPTPGLARTRRPR